MTARIKDRRMLEKLSQALTEIMGNLGSVRLEERLTIIARLATALLDAEVSAILLVKRRGFLTLEASYGHRRGKFQKGREFAIRSGRKAGLTAHIAAKGRLFNAHGKALTSHYAVKGTKSDHIPSGKCCSLLAIPLQKKSAKGKRLIGLLRVENKLGPAGPSSKIGFSKEDEWVLRIFAEAIVVAIANVELVEQGRLQRNRLDRLIGNSPVGIVSVDNTGHVVQYNPRAEQILGYTAKEAIDKIHVKRLYSEPKTLRLIGKRLNSSKDGMISRFRTDLKSKSGESIPVSLAITRLYDGKKNRLGSVGYFEDLRLIQEKERYLDLLLQASNTISKAKTIKTGLERLARMMVSLITSTFCRILLIDETRQYLIPSAAYPVPRVAGDLKWEPGLNRLLTISDWPELMSWLLEGKPRLIANSDKAYRSRLRVISKQMRLKKSIQSLLIVPLKVESKLVGILEVGEVRRTERASFSAERISLLGAIAAQTAVLIDRIRLHEETVRHNHLLRSSFLASTELISSRDPYDVIHDIVERMRKDAKASWVSLVFIDEAGGIRRKAIQSGAEAQPIISTVIRSNGNSMLVMRTGKALAIENVKEGPENVIEGRRGFNPIMLKESNVAAALCLPVSLQGVRIGVLWIHYDQPRHFSKSEINAWQLYVNHAAKAFDNAQRMDELKRMRDAAEAFAKAADTEALVQQIVQSACEVLQAKAAALWWYDSIRDMFVAGKSVACGIPEEVWNRFKTRGPHPQGTAYTVLQKGLIEVRDTQSRQADSLVGEGTRELLEKIGVRRFLGIALALGKEKFGVLYIDYEVPRKFSKEERETVSAFANQATLALKKTKLLEDVDKARDVAGAVAKVTTLGELSGTLRLIVQETKKALNCDAITLYEYDHLKREISPEPVMEGVRNKEGTRQYPEVQSDSIVTKMLRRKRMLVVGNVHHSPLFANSRFARDERIQSCLAIPLLVGKVKVGVMFVNYLKRHLFTVKERTNIELFASQAAVAISNAQLYESEQKRTQSLEALHKAGQAITGSLDERKILKTIARQAWQIAKSRGKLANFADIRMRHGNKLKLDAVYPAKILLQAHGHLDYEIDLSQGLAGNIGIIGRTVLLEKPQLVPNVHKVAYYRRFHDQTNSELAVPIKLDDSVVGMINVEHPAFNAFDERDLHTFESLAAQASIAIQNARSYADLKKTITSLEAKTQLAWMGMASATWRHRIENHARIINIHLHNIGKEGITKTAAAAGARNELAGIGRMARKILRTPTTVPLSAPRKKPLRICDFISKHIEQLKRSNPYKSVDCTPDFRVSKSTTVKASGLWLKQALEILYDNAAEAMKFSKQKKLVIRVQQEHERLEIRIIDTGKGIPRKVQDQLFQGRVKKNRGAPGLGFGLLQAQAIIEQHGGDIKHEPSNRKGTTMLVWLPLG